MIGRATSTVSIHPAERDSASARTQPCLIGSLLHSVERRLWRIHSGTLSVGGWMRAFSLSVFMPQGEPQGLRLVTKTNWTGVGVFFPRTCLNPARERAELGRTGVYVLWNDDDQLRPSVYVGQSEDVSRRIKEHFDDEAMDWWTKAAAFTTKDNAFNQAHARYLEWALEAREVNRCHLRNRLQPSRPSVSGLMRQMRRIFSPTCSSVSPSQAFRSLRLQCDKEEWTIQRGSMELHLDRTVIGVRATAVPGVAEFTVLKGARVRPRTCRRGFLERILDIKHCGA